MLAPKLQVAPEHDREPEKQSEIEIFESGKNTLLNKISHADLLKGLSDKEIFFFVNLEQLIKSGQNPEQVINFLLKSIANKDLDNGKFRKLISYAEYCPLLESFISMIPVPTPEMCQEAINNKNHPIWLRLTKCECMNARVLHMGFIQNKYPEKSRGEILSDTRSLINEIGLRHRTQEIEKTKINRHAIKQVFVTAYGLLGKY